MRRKYLILVHVVLVAVLILSGCGGDDDDPASGSPEAEEPAAAGSGGGAGEFDFSSLPDDFPTDLIPETFDTGSYLDLGDVMTAGFDSTVPVDETIEYYESLLGEPRVAVEGDPGERNVLWPPSDGWIVGVLGSPEESIVSISRTID